MAIASIGTRGTAVSGASGTTIARAPTATVVVDRILVCQVAQNGNQSVTVSDAVGNTWENLGTGSGTNARSDIWIARITTQLTTADNVTVTFGGAVVDKSMLLWEFSVAAGAKLVPSATEVPNSTTGTNGFGSVNFASLPSLQRLYLRALAKQANITTAITATTNFTTQALTIRSRNNTSAIIQRGEFRINTSTGETSNPTLANAGNTGNVFVALEEYTPPAAQTLTPGLYTNTNTFYGHTVAAGAVTLTAARYDNEQVFYSPTVSQTGGGQSLTPARYDNAQTFYAPTVAAGAVNLQPGLYSNANAFYAATVTAGGVTLTPARCDNANAFYGPTVTAGAVNLQPARYDNTSVFYGPIVSTGASIILPPRYDNAQTFYGPTVTTFNTLTPARFDNAQVFYSPTVGIVAAQSLLPGLYTNANEFYAARTTLYITFPDWVEPGWVEPGWVEWPYFNRNEFFAADVTQGPPGPVPVPDDQRGDGVDARWTPKERKARDRKLAEERQERDKLRRLIERAIDPIEAKTAEVVVKTPQRVTIAPTTGAEIAIPVPPTLDVAEVSRMVSEVLQRQGIEAQRVQQERMEREARAAAEENLRARVLKRKREDELLLLM
jgi:hypothetical protein